MADYAINNVPRRVVYAPSGTGPYAFTFEILDDGDIAVYKGDTLLTLTTDYTVTINANGTGFVTLTTSAGTSQITIVGSKTIARTTDFTTGGDFFANTLNDELDAQTIFIQQVAETAERGLKAPVTDPTDINMTLPRKDNRKGTVLAFNATTGNPEVGPTVNEVVNAQQYAENAADSADAAAASASAAASSASSASSSASTATTKASEASASASSAATAKTAAETAETNAETAQTASELAALNSSGSADSANQSAILANDWATKTSGPVAGGEYSAKYHAQQSASSASSASTSAGTATTKAGEASSSATAAASSASQAAASAAAAASAYDSFDDRYLGSKTSAPTLDNDGNPLVSGALYYNSVLGTMYVYDGGQWIAASAASQAILTVYKFTATAGQTTFSGTDDGGLTLGYTVGSAIITVNGTVYEVGTDVTASSGSSIVLAAGATVGDEVNIYAFSTFNVANTYTQAQVDAALATKANSANVYTKTEADAGFVAKDVNGNGLVGTLTAADSSAKLTVSGVSTVLLDSSGHLIRFNKTAGTDTAWVSNRSYGWHNGNGLAISTQTADPLRFGTNSTERMTIDSSGRVAMPYQPSFSAGSNSGDTSVASLAAVPFDTTSGGGFNVGNCYNTSTYRFTAPIAGKYEFTCIAYYTNSGGNTQSMQLAPYVNGAQVLIGGDAILFSACAPNSLGNTVVFAGTVILNLSANDYVQVISRGTTARLYMGHTKFLGRLVG